MLGHGVFLQHLEGAIVRLGLLTLLLACSLAGVAAPASAVTLDWVVIGNTGNAPDTASNCDEANCGSVAYSYRISKYEVTNAQYAEFLNAVDPTGANSLALYDSDMGSNPTNGGILLVGSNAPGSRYVVKTTGGYGGTGFANKPVTYVTFYDALRFANWLNNGQGAASTETGAYTLLGGTPTPSNGTTVVRNALATTFLPSENEWYKAAYHGPGGMYFEYPTGTDTPTGCVAPGADTGDSANCGPATGNQVTDVGAYALSNSPYGTFDQGGNVFEWNEQMADSDRGIRGGSWGDDASVLAASYRLYPSPTSDVSGIGFRVASLVPEPGTGIFMVTELLGLASLRRRRAQAL
jgi:formylglycine-generating enzyme required for sulfatase activity